MSEAIYPVRPEVAAGAHVDAAGYDRLYAEARDTPDAFWLKQAERLAWITPPTTAGDWSFDEADFGIKWFADGALNVSTNCLDRHLAERAEQIAIIWEGDDPADIRRISYAELHADVCRLANVLTAQGVRRGDRVTIYLPMIPEAAVAMLACTRIGAIHSIVFGGFSPDALANRIQDCDSRLVITADGGRRGGKTVALKTNVDAALESCPCVESVIVVRHTGDDVTMRDGRDHDYSDLMADAATTYEPQAMRAEDALFILYTSGSTGKPKGVLHTTGGYLLWGCADA